MKKSITTLAILGTACAATGAVQAQERVFEQPYWTKQPVIEALGRAEVEIAPNRAAFSVSFTATDKQAGDATLEAVERARLAYDAVKAVAGEASIVSSSMTTEPFYEQYKDKDGDYWSYDTPDKIKGYEVRATLRVELTDPALAGRARAAAVTLGPEDAGDLRYYIEQSTDIALKAFEAAAADASARAQAAAKASGQKLGTLLVLQEGHGPCLGSWTTPIGRSDDYMPRAAPMAEMAADSIIVTGSRRGKAVTITEADIAAATLPSDETPQTVSSRVCAVYAVGE